uniref:SHOCT-like domain-containing protein n=1 Tax=Exiguobacterium sp. TaxID=44751 RepID=UPI0037BF7D87
MKQDMRQLILEQVKEGKLTIDEALDKLERLEAIDERATSASEHKYVDEPEQYDRVDQYSVDSLTTKVMSAFDNLVSRIKDSDLSLKQASGPNVTDVKQFPCSGETVHFDRFN